MGSLWPVIKTEHFFKNFLNVFKIPRAMPGIVASIKFHVFFPNFSHFSNENKTPCTTIPRFSHVFNIYILNPKQFSY